MRFAPAMRRPFSQARRRRSQANPGLSLVQIADPHVGRRNLLATLSDDELSPAASFERLLVVLLYFSFFFGMYNGAMVAALTEVMPQNG